MRSVHKLNKEEGITIVIITHFMEEAVTADRVVVMKNGVKLQEGTPREIFTQVDTLKRFRLRCTCCSRGCIETHSKGRRYP